MPLSHFQIGASEDSLSPWTRLFRRIVVDMSISPYQWQMLIQQYIEDESNRVSKEPMRRHAATIALEAQLNKDHMTYRDFGKAVKFLQIQSFDLVIRPTFSTGLTTQHTVPYKAIPQ